MVVFDDAISIMQRLAQDTSASGLTYLELMYNVGYKEILAELAREQTEKDATADLVAGQRGYQVISDCLWVRSLELIDGTTIQPIAEVADDATWARLKSGNIQGRPTNYHFRPRFGADGGVIELNPIPSSSSYDMRMTYESNDKDLSKLAYSTGTVDLTGNSATITGHGTTFTSDMAGRYFQLTADGTDRLWYRVQAYVSATSLTLEQVYNGATITGTTFRICEAPNLPEDLHMLPVYFSLKEWWASKKNAEQIKEYEAKYTLGMTRAKKRHAAVTHNGIINPAGPLLPFEQYPSYYPTSITA